MTARLLARILATATALGKIEYRWSGQVFDTVDYLPFIGLNPGNRFIFIHTGDSAPKSGPAVHAADIMMTADHDRIRVAREVLSFAERIGR